MGQPSEDLPPGYNNPGTSNDSAWSAQTYSLEDSKGRPWVWLNVKSRARGDKLPLFFETDAVQGAVEIDFDKADGVKGLRVAVIAGVTTVGQEELMFLDVTEVLWDSKASKTKPKGKSSYPFSLSLPGKTAVSEKPKAPSVEYQLPPSFSERASNAYIDYRIVVTVRKGMFKVNQTLTTSFVYIPVSRADPPSQLRQVAYRWEESALPGPERDSEGWNVLPPVNVTGTLFNARSTEVTCVFAIAQPLSYAIGSPIPLYMTLTSDDSQALDLLSTPSSIKVQLFRARAVGSSALKTDTAGRSDNTFREVCGTAVFWPTTMEDASVDGKRRLQGELEVRKWLKPSFTFPQFTLKYSVSLMRFDAPGFVQTGTDPVLQTEKVVIHTANAIGVTPRSYAPPGYEHKEEGNYNNAVGYLEIGNQRFYHHGGFQ